VLNIFFGVSFVEESAASKRLLALYKDAWSFHQGVCYNRSTDTAIVLKGATLMSSHTRESVRAQLEEAQAAFRDLLAVASEEDLQKASVTPEWNGVDLLRHMLAWNEPTLRSLDDWQGDRSWVPMFDDEDPWNQAQVAARRDLHLDQLVRKLEAAHARYAAELTDLSDDELAHVAVAPWNETISRLRTISGIAWHDGMHVGMIRKALEK
jgi:hypothetical protein